MADSLLGPLTELPLVLREHVLKKLNPTDLSLLSLTCKRVRAAVEESGRPVAGVQAGPWGIIELSLVLFMGSDTMAMWAQSNANCVLGPEVCMHLATKGDLEGLKRAHRLGWPLNEWTCRECAHAGNLDMLMWAREAGAHTRSLQSST